MQQYLTLIALAFAAPAWACEDRVVGHVGTETGEPVAGARVQLGDVIATTADDGRFVLQQVCAGELKVLHPAYQPWSSRVQAPLEHLDITVTPDAEVIVVEQVGAEVRDPHARSTIEGVELERSRGLDLAEAVASIAGVSVLRTSSDSTRPMVRGLYGRRLLLLRDGMRHASQKWGDEHAPELDPFEAGAITVIRGAAGVPYGPDALGGVVLIEPPPLRKRAGVGGRVDLVAESNGARGTGAATLDASNGEGLALRLQANLAKGQDLRAPGYLLGNTASQTANLGFTTGLERGTTRLELGWRHHNSRAGLCFCQRVGSPSDLQAAYGAAVPPGADGWTASPAIERPRQSVLHDVLYARLRSFVGVGTVTVTWNTQLNRRKEYEPVRDSVEGPQLDLALRTHDFEASLVHRSVHLGSLATMEGTVGVSGNLQENEVKGLPLIPNHRALTGGVHLTERLSFGHALLEAGARLDHRTRTSFFSETTYEGHLRRSTLSPDSCEETPTAFACRAGWTAASATVGGIWHDPQERLELRVDLSTASRFPDGDELYLNGAAPSQPVYALGNPSLRTETTWGASPTAGVSLPGLRAEVSGFLNRIEDYVRFGPDLDASGQPGVEVTVRGAFPRYSTRQVDAWMWGAEAELEAEITRWVEVSARGAVVRGQEQGSGAYLPFIPPDRAGAAVELRLPDALGLDAPSIRLEGEAVARQFRSDTSTDLVPAAKGYAVVHGALELPWQLDAQRLTVGVSLHNVFNARVRSYTSLLRPFADEPGRSLRARVGFEF